MKILKTPKRLKKKHIKNNKKIFLKKKRTLRQETYKKEHLCTKFERFILMFEAMNAIWPTFFWL